MKNESNKIVVPRNQKKIDEIKNNLRYYDIKEYQEKYNIKNFEQAAIDLSEEIYFYDYLGR